MKYLECLLIKVIQILLTYPYDSEQKENDIYVESNCKTESKEMQGKTA